MKRLWQVRISPQILRYAIIGLCTLVSAAAFAAWFGTKVLPVVDPTLNGQSALWPPGSPQPFVFLWQWPVCWNWTTSRNSHISGLRDGRLVIDTRKFAEPIKHGRIPGIGSFMTVYKHAAAPARLIVSINLFGVVLLFGAYPCLVFIRGPVRRFRRRRNGLCPQCGYNLRGNVSGRCLECGRKTE